MICAKKQYNNSKKLASYEYNYGIVDDEVIHQNCLIELKQLKDNNEQLMNECRALLIENQNLKTSQTVGSFVIKEFEKSCHQHHRNTRNPKIQRKGRKKIGNDQKAAKISEREKSEIDQRSEPAQSFG